MAAFLGTLIGVVKMVASIAQGTSPSAQSARRQRPCCRLLRVEFILQNEYASYTGRSGRASVRSRRSAGRGFSSSRSRLAKSNGRFALLDLRQDCFFRVSLPKQHSSYSPPTADRSISSAHPFTVKLRSDSFQKLRMLRNRLDLISRLHSELFLPMSPLSRRRDDFQNCGGSERSGQKNFQKVLIHRQNIKSSLLINSRLFLFFI